VCFKSLFVFLCFYLSVNIPLHQIGVVEYKYRAIGTCEDLEFHRIQGDQNSAVKERSD